MGVVVHRSGPSEHQSVHMLIPYKHQYMHMLIYYLHLSATRLPQWARLYWSLQDNYPTADAARICRCSFLSLLLTTPFISLTAALNESLVVP